MTTGKYFFIKKRENVFTGDWWGLQTISSGRRNTIPHAGIIIQK